MIPGQRGTTPPQRGTIPAQHGTIGARDTVSPPPAAETAVIPPVAATAVPAPTRDTGATVPAPGPVVAPAVPPVPDPPVPAPAAALPETGTPAAPLTGSQTDVAASGPKAAKAAVQKKLAHARVLLSQRAAQAAAAPPTAVPPTATAFTATPSTATASTATASPAPAVPVTTTASLAAPSTITTAATTAPAAVTPPAASPSGTYATKARKAISFARAQVGKPCVWGAAGPGSYDCAGLTQAAWKSAGVTLPRTAREQAEAGTPVAPADARPGDLVFFHDDAAHVGLCTGDGMMIHAPRPGAYVREEPVSGMTAAVHSVVRPG
ncbi:C40 family peptidase [Streptomyces sp. NPDC004658]|uniref:C40 family peptidase n=1 Tax=Streptomyces sp. NPDC004658 TaxID=3154672 RepID=UPI0033A9CFA9